jgi:hypothetical protein
MLLLKNYFEHINVDLYVLFVLDIPIKFYVNPISLSFFFLFFFFMIHKLILYI